MLQACTSTNMLKYMSNVYLNKNIGWLIVINFQYIYLVIEEMTQGWWYSWICKLILYVEVEKKMIVYTIWLLNMNKYFQIYKYLSNLKIKLAIYQLNEQNHMVTKCKSNQTNQ